MLISKITKSGRTTGIYGHFPKFINLKKVYRFDNVPNDTNHPYWDWMTPEARTDAQHEHWKNAIAARQMVFPWRVSYVGYLVFITKKHRYNFWYMGNPYREKIFEKF